MNKILLLTMLTLCCSFSFAQKDIFNAARTGNIKLISKLIKKDKNVVNAVNENGHSPLILACYSNQLETVEILIENGADVNYEMGMGSAVHAAAYKGNTDILVLLLQNNASIDKADQNGTTPLIYATLANHYLCAAVLIEYGANPNTKDATNSSALEYAKELKLDKFITLFTL